MFTTKNGVVRGTNWIRQTLRDVLESKNREGLCGIPWQMLGPELKLTKKVTFDKEGAAPPLPRLVVEREDSSLCLLTLSLTDTLEVVQVQRSIRDFYLEKQGSMQTKTEALRERVKERKRARVERGAGDVLTEPRNRDEEQMAVRHADASGGDITENQHEENIMRDIHVGNR